jgi:hypothetical protein
LYYHHPDYSGWCTVKHAILLPSPLLLKGGKEGGLLM